MVRSLAPWHENLGKRQVKAQVEAIGLAELLQRKTFD